MCQACSQAQDSLARERMASCSRCAINHACQPLRQSESDSEQKSGSTGGKHWAAEWFGEGAVATHVVCSLASAAVSVACVNPVDVVRTRVFNQPVGPDGVGLRYSGGVDAALQLVRAEGPLAFYKGAGAHYAVSAPR